MSISDPRDARPGVRVIAPNSPITIETRGGKMRGRSQPISNAGSSRSRKHHAERSAIATREFEVRETGIGIEISTDEFRAILGWRHDDANGVRDGMGMAYAAARLVLAAR